MRPNEECSGLNKIEEPAVNDRLIQIKEVCQRIGVARTYIYDALRDPGNGFPRPVKTRPGKAGRHAGRNLWSESEISSYIDTMLARRRLRKDQKQEELRSSR